MTLIDRIHRVKRAWVGDMANKPIEIEPLAVEATPTYGLVLDTYLQAKIQEMLRAQELEYSKSAERPPVLTSTQRAAGARKVARLQRHARQTAVAILFLGGFLATGLEFIGSYFISNLNPDDASPVSHWQWLKFSLNTADMVAALVGMLTLIATLNIALVIRPPGDSKDDAPMLAWVQASTRIADTTAVLGTFFAFVQWTNPDVRANSGSGAAVVVLAGLCVFLAANIRSWTDHQIAIQIDLKENEEIEGSIKSALAAIKVQSASTEGTGSLAIIASLAVRSLLLTAAPIGFTAWLLASNVRDSTVAIIVLGASFWLYSMIGLQSVTERRYGKALRDDFRVFVSWMLMTYSFVLWFYLIVVLAVAKLPHVHWLVIPLGVTAALSLVGVYVKPMPGKPAERRLAFRLESASMRVKSKIEELKQEVHR